MPGCASSLRDALRQGALGLSTGLAYASAFQSTTEEVMALAEELAAEKGIYTTHLRSEFEPILDALDEVPHRASRQRPGGGFTS